MAAWWRDGRGFSAVELVITCAVIGVISAIAAPSFASYWRSSTVQAGAIELMAALNRARQIAVARTTDVCVQRSGTDLVLRVGGCAGSVWVGFGTDSAGVVRLGHALQVTAGPDMVFTSLGGASTVGVYTVTNPLNGATRTVAVAASGRISVQ